MDLFVANNLGNRIYYDPTDTRGLHLANAHGNLNQLSLELWNKALALQPWDLVVDVGCNYGEMIVGAKMPEMAQLIAFEPSPRVLPYLLNRGLLYSQDAIMVNAPLLLKNSAPISDTHLHTNSVLSTKRRGVYTALMGNYEQLNEQPLAASSAFDFICFNDDPHLVS